MRGSASTRRPVTPTSRSNQTVSASNEVSRPPGNGHRPVNASCGRREYGRSSGSTSRSMTWKSCTCPSSRQPWPSQASRRLRFEEHDAGPIGTEAEVLEVPAVAHVREVGVEAEPVREVGPVHERRVPAVLARQVVAGQVVGVELAAAALRQIAEVRAGAEATTRKQEGRERQVVVRREVEVVGHAQLEAALVRVAERREQEAGLAGRPDGKRDHRRVEDRDALEVDADVATPALLRTLVDLDARSAQLPVRAAHRAGREAHAGEVQVALARHLELGGRAPRGPLRQLELGARELTRAQRIPAARAALQPQLRRTELDVALDLEAALGGVIGRRIGRDLPVALDDRHAARELRVALAGDLTIGGRF